MFKPIKLTSLACLFALIIAGCDHSWYPEGPKPAVKLGEAELGLPIFAGAQQIVGKKDQSTSDATFETKAEFDQVVTFYRQKVGSWLKLDVTDRGGTQKFAYGSARNGAESFQIKLDFMPTGYTRIRLMRGS